MAKLNTSVNNIQLKSNKVDADLPSSDWTTEQYPSARSLYNVYNLLYPVGSVLCMATNTNPASTLGIGTWELIDKEFKSQCIDISSGSGWSGLSADAPLALSGCGLAGHTLSLHLCLNFMGNLASDGTAPLGTLDPSFVGLTEFPMAKQDIPYVTATDNRDDDAGIVVGKVSIIETGSVQINGACAINSDGEIVQSIDRHEIVVQADYAVHYTKMLDSFCDKFYFKRVS